MLVTENTVIVACDIHVRIGIPGLQITWIKGGATLHEVVTYQAGEGIVKLTSNWFFLLFGLRSGCFLSLLCSELFCVLGAFFCLIITVNSKSDGT